MSLCSMGPCLHFPKYYVLLYCWVDEKVTNQSSILLSLSLCQHLTIRRKNERKNFHYSIQCHTVRKLFQVFLHLLETSMLIFAEKKKKGTRDETSKVRSKHLQFGVCAIFFYWKKFTFLRWIKNDCICGIREYMRKLKSAVVFFQEVCKSL